MHPFHSGSRSIGLALVFCWLTHAYPALAQQHSPWEPCALEIATSDNALDRIDVPAGPTACVILFYSQSSSGDSSAEQFSDNGSTGTGSSSSGPELLRLASSSMLAGVRNISLGRPAAVEVRTIGPGAAAAAAASAVVKPLMVPPGGTLLLQDLLLLNAALVSPNGDPTKALLPTGVLLPPGALLKLRDVMLVVTQDTLQQYIGFMLGVPKVTLLTDNVSFLHIRNYTSEPFGIVEARSVTLIAPEGSRINNVPLGVLRSIAYSNSKQQQQQAAALQNPGSIQAARGDAAGIVTVTDSYILGATNSTIIQLLQQQAGKQDSQQPLFMAIASNVSLAPRFWGSRWPAQGLIIRRPTIWVGSSWDSTSIDFGMQVGQIVLQGDSSNVTLFNVDLENLAYGDEQSAADAMGNSILLSNQLWAFRYKRSVPRLVLWDVVLVIPEQRQIENVIYYVNAFNSDLQFWRNQTTFLRDTLKYTVIRYTRGRIPGDYIIITAYKKDQLMNNITYTSIPRIAPPLNLTIDPSLHLPLLGGQSESVIGTVSTTTGLAVTLWNQRQGSCNRPHVLLVQLVKDPALASNTSLGPAVSWAPGPLNVSAFATDAAPIQAAGSGASNVANASSSTGLSSPAAVDGTGWGVSPNATLLEPLPVGDGVPLSWPPPGGELIACPAQIRGAAQNVTGQNLLVDVNFTGNLFQVQLPDKGESLLVDVNFNGNLFQVQLPDKGKSLLVDVNFTGNLSQAQLPDKGPPAQPDAAAGAAIAAAAAAANRPVLFEFRDLSFIHVPQGPGSPSQQEQQQQQQLSVAAQPADSSSSSAISSSSTGDAGNTVWMSLLPADAYTHLVWFVNRNFTTPGLVTLTNVTLFVPPPEASQMIAATTAALTAAGGNVGQAVLIMIYPTPQGPLPVVYRSISVYSTAPRAAAAAAPGTAPGGTRRRKVLQEPMAGSSTQIGRATAHTGRGLLQSAAAAAPANASMVCIGDVQGFGLRGRNICMASQPEVDPLPPGYYWAGFSTGSSSSAAPQKLSPGAIAGIVIGAVVVVAAVAAAAALGAKLGKCCKQQQRLSKVADHQDDLQLVRHVGSSSTRGGTPSPGAVSSAVLEVELADKNVGNNKNNNSSSSEGVWALAQRLRECCPGSSSDNTALNQSSSSVSSPPPAVPAAAKVGSSSPVLSAAAAKRSSSTREHSGLHQGQTGGTAVVVDLGEQLSKLAAIHKLCGSQSGRDLASLVSFPPDLTHGVPPDPNPGQPTDRDSPTAIDLDDESSFQDAAQFMQRRQQLSQAATVARLSQAISTLSNEMQFRRLTNSSLTTQAMQSRYSAGTSSALAASGRGSGISSSKPPAAAGPAYCLSIDKTSINTRGVVSRRDGAGKGLEKATGNDEMTPDQGLLVSQAAAEPPRWPFPDPRQQPGQAILISSRDQRATSTTSGGSSKGHQTAAAAASPQLQLHEVIGSGTFGVVYRATWRGIPAAVKVVQLLGGADRLRGEGVGGNDRGPSRREHMAVMETALGSSLSHPNIVQVYTYLLRPLAPVASGGGHTAAAAAAAAGRGHRSSSRSSSSQAAAEFRGQQTSGALAAMGHELQLVMEYCPLGSLRSAIDACFLEDRLTGRPHYPTVLHLALGVARAMHHLHCEGVIHGDLKAGNVLLKMEVQGSTDAAGNEQPVVVAKVADFGLATTLDDTDTHVSGVHRGTLSHMAPELLLQGRASLASDVYAMGVLLWELATGQRAFSDIPKAMLGAAVVRDRTRPEWPDGSSCNHAFAIAAAAAAAAGMPLQDVHPPTEYRQLTEACWAHDPTDRPTFADISAALEYLLAQEQRRMAALTALTAPQQQQQLPFVPCDAAAAASPARQLRTSSGAQPLPATTLPGKPSGSGAEPASVPAAAAAALERQSSSSQPAAMFPPDSAPLDPGADAAPVGVAAAGTADVQHHPSPTATPSPGRQPVAADASAATPATALAAVKCNNSSSSNTVNFHETREGETELRSSSGEFYEDPEVGCHAQTGSELHRELHSIGGAVGTGSCSPSPPHSSSRPALRFEKPPAAVAAVLSSSTSRRSSTAGSGGGTGAGSSRAAVAAAPQQTALQPTAASAAATVLSTSPLPSSPFAMLKDNSWAGSSVLD